MNVHTVAHLLSQKTANSSFLRGTQQSTQSHNFPVHKAKFRSGRFPLIKLSFFYQIYCHQDLGFLLQRYANVPPLELPSQGSFLVGLQ